MKGYNLNLLDYNLLQFARVLSVLNDTDLKEQENKKRGIAGLLGIKLVDLDLILERATQVANDFEVLRTADPMVTRRARATINGDKDYTANYDEGIEIVSTDGGTLWDIDINDDGSLQVGVCGVVRHKEELLDSKVTIEPRSYSSFTVRRPKYKS